MNDDVLLPGPGFGAGHTAQYLTLAQALRFSVEAMEEQIAYLEVRGLSHSNASLAIEAHVATITLLAGSFCESTANTILATLLPPTDFEKIEWERTVKKWVRVIPDLLKCDPPLSEVREALMNLIETRNAITHGKAMVFADGETVVHAGNVDLWTRLTPENARCFASVPSRLFDMIPDNAEPLIRMIGFALRDRAPFPPEYFVRRAKADYVRNPTGD